MKYPWLSILLLAALLWSCEEEFIPDEITVVPQIVVEGYVEAAGENSTPPYVILTRNLPFFSTLDSTEFSDIYVHDALVTVDNGDAIMQLTEVCLNDLSPEQVAVAEAFLGVNIDLVPISFCVYLDLTLAYVGEAGKTYDLRIEAEDKVITASTTIPEHAPLDSLWFVEPPGQATRDTLAQLQVQLTDPAGPTFYRYFVNANNAGFQRDDFSVLDDGFFDGEEIVFPLNKPAVDSVDFDLSTFGLFTRGDEVTVKWITFERDVFDFWNTIEFAAANQGPFSNATIIDSNVEGGLGVWAGQSASYYDLVVPER
ncbi:MAG: DUF4249 domain-containing protein [Bacteroidota bacterium]